MAIELIRERSKVSGDVALSVLFYGGIAGGVMLASQSDSGANLDAYLFGQLTSVSEDDLRVIVILAIAVLAVTIGLRRPSSRCARTRSSPASRACPSVRSTS